MWSLTWKDPPESVRRCLVRSAESSTHTAQEEDSDRPRQHSEPDVCTKTTSKVHVVAVGQHKPNTMNAKGEKNA